MFHSLSAENTFTEQTFRTIPEVQQMPIPQMTYTPQLVCYFSYQLRSAGPPAALRDLCLPDRVDLVRANDASCEPKHRQKDPHCVNSGAPRRS